MTTGISDTRLAAALRTAREALLAERTPEGRWIGELSASALSTATAVSALSLVRRTADGPRPPELATLVEGGIRWLATHQNADGGWGDTTVSFSNISTTMLVRAAFHIAGAVERFPAVGEKATGYIDRIGGVAAVRRRYGKDHTFSVPILTNCALAGQVEWGEIEPLPFELSCLPHSWFAWLNLPVVSYALPALIAIGQIRHFKRPSWNPLVRIIRTLAVERSLEKLTAIQPSSGGFLEATPLTSFVTMSLAGMGRADHPVARKGVEFLIRSVRPDGSWPIDTDLSVWVTTLSVNALAVGGPLAGPEWEQTRDWLLARQYREVHPYTMAAPGAWAWTDLAGGVPDADDTPGALLALANLPACPETLPAAERGVRWLLDLQNDDGGWPTFCRGWANLPFDRSGADITAHVMRALHRSMPAIPDESRRIRRALRAGLTYLTRAWRADDGWLPLWFGNQHAPDDINPVYGTARVLAAYRDLGIRPVTPVQRAMKWLASAQNPDGGWGGAAGIESSIEETALAAEVLLGGGGHEEWCARRGIEWLVNRVTDGSWCRPTPIGFYFAKLWYWERLYPQIFTVAALSRAAAAP